MIPFYMVQLAANIMAVYYLIRMGGVIPIACSIIMLIGQIWISGAIFATFTDAYYTWKKRKETKKDVGMGESTSVDDVLPR